MLSASSRPGAARPRRTAACASSRDVDGDLGEGQRLRDDRGRQQRARSSGRRPGHRAAPRRPGAGTRTRPGPRARGRPGRSPATASAPASDRSGVSTGRAVAKASRHGPSPRVNWSSSISSLAGLDAATIVGAPSSVNMLTATPIAGRDLDAARHRRWSQPKTWGRSSAAADSAATSAQTAAAGSPMGVTTAPGPMHRHGSARRRHRDSSQPRPLRKPAPGSRALRLNRGEPTYSLTPGRSGHPRRRRGNRACATAARAAFIPGAPWTPPPGWADAEPR